MGKRKGNLCFFDIERKKNEAESRIRKKDEKKMGKFKKTGDKIEKICYNEDVNTGNTRKISF